MLVSFQNGVLGGREAGAHGPGPNQECKASRLDKSITVKVFAPVSGWLGERYGARRLMLVGGLLYGGSMGLLGLVWQPWHFLLAFSLLRSLTQSICLVPLITAVSGWFRRRLGLATGILCKPRHDLLCHQCALKLTLLDKPWLDEQRSHVEAKGAFDM